MIKCQNNPADTILVVDFPVTQMYKNMEDWHRENTMINISADY